MTLEERVVWLEACVIALTRAYSKEEIRFHREVDGKQEECSAEEYLEARALEKRDGFVLGSP